MSWALANRHIVFTHDLDFGTTLALTGAAGPSVVQLRGRTILPDDVAPLVIAALRDHEVDLLAGALLVLDEVRRRVRILPF